MNHQPPIAAARRVLVCVSGMSPAVITETLYALVTQKGFVPDEVHVITTVKGKTKVVEQLLGRPAAPGAFHALMADYLPGRTIRFDEDTIHVIAPLDGGTLLDDIQDDAENRHAANTIYRVLRQLKSVPGTQLHASVAGGRKSMSFYMGHAFSMVADASDQLSHVLVNEPFENRVPEFYYPPLQPRELLLRGAPTGGGASDAARSQTISTAAAQVTLARLSVLRLGPLLDTMPERALTDFDFAVSLAQAVVVAPEVRIVWNKVDEAGHVEVLDQRIDLTYRQFLLLALQALARKHENELIDGPLLSADELWRVMAVLLGEDAPADVADLDKFLREIRSKLQARAAERIGPAARWLMTEPQGRRSAQKVRPHALLLPADSITLVNLPVEWWEVLRHELT